MITEAGTHDKVAALVYIAAFVPDGSESVNTLISGFPADGPQPPILPPRAGFLFLTDAARSVLAGDPAAARRAARARAEHFPWSTSVTGMLAALEAV